MACRRFLALVVVLAAAGCNNDDTPGPRIDELAPPQAMIGQVINILGERFCAQETNGSPDASSNPCAAGFVTFGPLDGLRFEDAEEWTDTRIIIRVPNIGPGPTSVVVTVNGRQSAPADFEVIQQ